MVVSGSLCQCTLHACVPVQHNPHRILLRALLLCPCCCSRLDCRFELQQGRTRGATSDTKLCQALGQQLTQSGPPELHDSMCICHLSSDIVRPQQHCPTHCLGPCDWDCVFDGPTNKQCAVQISHNPTACSPSGSGSLLPPCTPALPHTF